jgi:hypothetical protein
MYPSGLWRGFWEQGAYGRQFMNDFTLNFKDGEITGQGYDIVGIFAIHGSYQAASIEFTKKYLGAHYVVYTGNYDGEGSINGTWEIPGFDRGPFSLSPSPRKADPNEPVQEIGPKS